MPDIRPAFVFVHGAWHNAATWHKLIPLLEARGYVARALDLPRAVANARAPSPTVGVLSMLRPLPPSPLRILARRRKTAPEQSSL